MKKSDTNRADDLLDPARFWEGDQEEEKTEELGVPPPRVVESKRSEKPGSFPPNQNAWSNVSKPFTPGEKTHYPLEKAAEKAPSTKKPTTREKPAQITAQATNQTRKNSVFLYIGLAILAFLTVVYFFRSEQHSEEEQIQTAKVELPTNLSPNQPQSSGLVAKKAIEKTSLTGTLRIQSNPPGAVVFINGQVHGSTPTEISGLPIGEELQIRLEAEGYRPWEHKITIDSIMPKREIRAGLLADTACSIGEGWLHIVTEPKQAIVELNGKRLAGSTPLLVDKICAGEKFTLKLQKQGYRPVVIEDVMIAPGEVKSINVELKK